MLPNAFSQPNKSVDDKFSVKPSQKTTARLNFFPTDSSIPSNWERGPSDFVLLVPGLTPTSHLKVVHIVRAPTHPAGVGHAVHTVHANLVFGSIPPRSARETN